MVRQTVIPDAIPQVVIEVVGAPLRLVIASLGINAAIQPVGLTSEGDMAIGNDTTQVAWYQLGPKPGEKGSAVIAGHYGGKYRSDVVFYNLDSLKTGDTVSVHDDTNNVRNFRVRSIRSYGPDDDTATVFSSSDGKAHLNLITCAGTWDASTQMYSERIVVFTDQDTAQY